MVKYNIEIEFNNAQAVNSVNALSAALKKLNQDISVLQKKNIFSSDNISSLKSASQAAANAANNTKKLGDAAKNSQTQFKFLNTAIKGFISVLSINKIAKAADVYTDMQNKIRALGGETVDYVSVQEELFRVANRSRSDVAATTQLYSRLMIAQRQLGASSADLMRFTEGVGKALQISGTSAFTQRGVLLQLSQAIGTDVVRAEEFNSILEGGIRIAQAAADGMARFGGNVAALRKAIINGEISSREFFEAILSQLPKLEAEFSKTTPTISQAFTVLNNGFTKFIGDTNSAFGISKYFAKALIDIGNNMDALAAAIAIATSAYVLFNAQVKISLSSLATLAKHPVVLALTALAGVYLLLRDNVDSATRKFREINSVMDTNARILEDIDKQTKQSLQGRIDSTKQALKEAIALEKLVQSQGKYASNYETMLFIFSKIKEFIVDIADGLVKVNDYPNKFFDRFSSGRFSSIPAGLEMLSNPIGAVTKKIGSFFAAAAQEDKLKRASSQIDVLKEQLKELEKEQEKAKNLSINNSQEIAKEEQKRLDRINKTIRLLQIEAQQTDMTTKQSAVWDALKKAGFEYDDVKVNAAGEATAKNQLYQERVEILAQLAIVTAQNKGPLLDLINEGKQLTEVWENNSVAAGSFYTELMRSRQGQNLLVSSLGDLEDSIVDFAKEGKFSFTDFANSFIENLLRIMTQMLITIPIAKAMWSALSGGIGSATGVGDISFDVGALQSSLNPGAIQVQNFAKGGLVSGLGTATSDSIPARLSNGEFVVNARSTSRYRPMLEAINRTPGYASGGIVGNAPVSGGVDIQIIDQRSNQSAPIETQRSQGSDGREYIKMIVRDTVKQGINNGEYDATFRNTYGVRRVGYNR